MLLTEQTASREQEIHSEDTQTSLLSACDDPEENDKGNKDEMIKTKTNVALTVFLKCFLRCLYRGDAIGQVVLAGNAQQFVLWQLEATEETWSRFLLQLRFIWTPVVRMTEAGIRRMRCDIHT